MGADKDWAGSMRYTRVEEQVSVKDSCDSDTAETEKVMRIPGSLSVPPRAVMEQTSWKSPSTITLSPRGIKEHNDNAVAVAADVAAKCFAVHHLHIKETLKAFSSFFVKLSPATALRKARDCYVRSLSNFASQLSSSAACGITYGVGYSSLGSLPAAWRSGSQVYREEIPGPGVCLSAELKRSLKDTHVSQSCKTFGSIPQVPAATGSRCCKVSSARVYAGSRSGVQSMPIYTIEETS